MPRFSASMEMGCISGESRSTGNLSAPSPMEPGLRLHRSRRLVPVRSALRSRGVTRGLMKIENGLRAG